MNWIKAAESSPMHGSVRHKSVELTFGACIIIECYGAVCLSPTIASTTKHAFTSPTYYSLMCVFESSPLTELPRGSLYMLCHSASASGTGLFLASETAVSTSFLTACMHDNPQCLELSGSTAHANMSKVVQCELRILTNSIPACQDQS